MMVYYLGTVIMIDVIAIAIVITATFILDQ